MPLTSRDLDEIRRIVREELARALGPSAPQSVVADATTELDAVGDQLHRRALESWDKLRSGSAERKARSIPDGPFVDRYDAARLLGVTESTITSYIGSGKLTRRLVKGRLQVSRAEIDQLRATRPQRRRSRPE